MRQEYTNMVLMGARALAFNVDRRFSNVIDALVVLVITRTETRLTELHMGRENTGISLNYHQKNNLKNCA